MRSHDSTLSVGSTAYGCLYSKIRPSIETNESYSSEIDDENKANHQPIIRVIEWES
jgi:hypothetical protein